MNTYRPEKFDREYKDFLIRAILEWAGDRFTREYLEKRTTAVLERIFDNC